MTQKNINPILALIKVQAEMGAIVKNAKNPFLKNDYADINAILETVLPILHANGFALIQCVNRDESGDFVHTQIINQETTWDSTVYLEYKKGDMQSYGGAITYARRYGITTLLCLRTIDDDGNHAVGHDKMEIKKLAKEKKYTPSQLRTLERAVDLERIMDNATREQLSKWHTEIFSLIENLKGFDQQRSDQIRDVYNKREKEVS